jgi:hypothetical protein
VVRYYWIGRMVVFTDSNSSLDCAIPDSFVVLLALVVGE